MYVEYGQWNIPLAIVLYRGLSIVIITLICWECTVSMFVVLTDDGKFWGLYMTLESAVESLLGDVKYRDARDSVVYADDNTETLRAVLTLYGQGWNYTYKVREVLAY